MFDSLSTKLQNAFKNLRGLGKISETNVAESLREVRLALLDADVAQLQATLGYTLAKADAFVAYNKLLQTIGVLSTELKK